MGGGGGGVGSDQFKLDAICSVCYHKKTVKLKFPYIFAASIKIDTKWL